MDNFRGGQVRNVEVAGSGHCEGQSRGPLLGNVTTDACKMIEFLNMTEERLRAFNDRLLGRAPPCQSGQEARDKPSIDGGFIHSMGTIGRDYDDLKNRIAVQIERLETIG